MRQRIPMFRNMGLRNDTIFREAFAIFRNLADSQQRDKKSTPCATPGSIRERYPWSYGKL